MRRLSILLLALLASHAWADTQNLSITVAGNNGSEESSTWGSDFLGFSTTEQIGLSFITTTAIPAGATINPSYMRMFCNFDDSTGFTANVAVENADPTTNTAWSSSHLPSGATIYTAISTGNVNVAVSTWFYGSADTGATNLAAALQSLLNQHGTIAIGERINIRFQFASGAGGAQFEGFGAAGTNEAELALDWTPAGAGTGIILKRRKH